MNSDWSNEDNSAFYEHHCTTLEEWAKQGGLATWPDLLTITDYIKPANTILEVGAGYGRVLDYLMMHYPKKELSALERSQHFSHQLEKKYGKNVTLYPTDVKMFYAEKRYDLILWLWSGLTDFAQFEQAAVLNHLARFLDPNGRLIVETFPHDEVPANGSINQPQTYQLTADSMQLHGYIPSPVEMEEYADVVGLKIETIRQYRTSSDRMRKLYVIKKT